MQGLYGMYGALSTEPTFGDKACLGRTLPCHVAIIGLYSVTGWLETETLVLVELPRSSYQATQLIYNDTHASHLLAHIYNYI